MTQIASFWGNEKRKRQKKAEGERKKAEEQAIHEKRGINGNDGQSEEDEEPTSKNNTEE